MNLKFRSLARYAVPAVAALSTGVVHAQVVIDTAEAEGFLTGQVQPALITIGGIFVLLAVIVAGYRWVRGSAGGA